MIEQRMVASGRLGLSANTVAPGDWLRAEYRTSAGQAAAHNWVGVWPADGNAEPEHGGYRTWTYAPDASGSAELDTSGLSPGDYRVFYLHDDGYEQLADPVRCTVRAGTRLPGRPLLGTVDLGGTLRRPHGIAVSPDGDIYLADTGNDLIRVLAPDLRPKRDLGHGRLREPEAVAVGTDGTVYVADTGNGCVRSFARNGSTAVLGTGSLDTPRGLAVTAEGQLLVCDSGINRVLRFAPGKSGPLGEIGSGNRAPQGIAVTPGGDILVTQNGWRVAGNDAVVRYDKAGTELGSYGAGQNSLFGGMSNPAFAVAGKQDTVSVTVPDYGWVTEFGPRGAPLREYGARELRVPLGIALDRSGRVLVADAGQHLIAIFGGN